MLAEPALQRQPVLDLLEDGAFFLADALEPAYRGSRGCVRRHRRVGEKGAQCLDLRMRPSRKRATSPGVSGWNWGTGTAVPESSSATKVM